MKRILSVIFAIMAFGIVSGFAQDSDAQQRTESLYNTARSSFSAFTDAREADPIDYPSYYPLVYQAAVDCETALKAAEQDSQPYHAIKEMMRQLVTPLENGAFYYSSVGDQKSLARYARKFIDIRINPAFKGETLPFDAGIYPAMAYNAACDAYNHQDFNDAIEYFKVYFSTGEKSQREQIYGFMGQAAMNVGKYDLAAETLREGVKAHPTNEMLRKLALKACIDGNRGEYIEELVNGGVALNPSDPKYIEIQGCILEDNLDFIGALAKFQELDRLEPNKMSTAKHIGLCYYNAAVNLFNQAQTVAKDEKEAGKMRRKARNYFAAAAQKLEEITAADPMNAKYLRALGVSYLCMEQKDLFQGVNNKLKAMGEDPLANVFMPPMVAYEGGGRKNFTYGGTVRTGVEVPAYSQFGKDYVTEGLSKWMVKGEFESVSDYQKRVGKESINREFDRLSHEAQEKYINQYSSQLRLSDVELKPYDVTSGSFRVDTNFGPFYVKVPNKDNEAELFKANWEGSQFLNTKFTIIDDKVQIASLTVLSPNGKKYDVSNDRLVNYRSPEVNVDVEALVAQINGNKSDSLDQGYGRQKYDDAAVTAQSDVDINIPENKPESTNKFALIIANENYDNVKKVQSAMHDGVSFRDYCIKTLGIPQSNVTYISNASLAKMRSELYSLQRKVDAYGEPVDVIFYYAGHGLPDDATKKAYLLPVDADPLMPSETGFLLEDLYSRLGSMKARSVSAFLDACFSGAQRDGDMIVAARGVVYTPKEAAPEGNMFVLSAASGQETAMPYREKNHGMFTYYLLKKLQESKGNASLKDIADYVISNVRRQSTMVNNKEQTPNYQVSGTMREEFKNKKLRGR